MTLNTAIERLSTCGANELGTAATIEILRIEKPIGPPFPVLYLTAAHVPAAQAIEVWSGAGGWVFSIGKEVRLELLPTDQSEAEVKALILANAHGGCAVYRIRRRRQFIVGNHRQAELALNAIDGDGAAEPHQEWPAWIVGSSTEHRDRF